MVVLLRVLEDNGRLRLHARLESEGTLRPYPFSAHHSNSCDILADCDLSCSDPMGFAREMQQLPVGCANFGQVHKNSSNFQGSLQSPTSMIQGKSNNFQVRPATCSWRGTSWKRCLDSRWLQLPGSMGSRELENFRWPFLYSLNWQETASFASFALQDLPGIYQESTRNLPGIYQESTRNLPGIYQESTRNLPHGSASTT